MLEGGDPAIFTSDVCKNPMFQLIDGSQIRDSKRGHHPDLRNSIADQIVVFALLYE